MDEIEKRLRDATDICIKTYDAWRKDPKASEVRENLMEAVHELRKIGARLEIEIAISERDEMAARPIPIPPHRASRKRGENGDDNIGNVMESQPESNQGSHSGGGGGGGFRTERSGGHRRGGHGGGGGPRRLGGGHGGGNPQGGGNRDE